MVEGCPLLTHQPLRAAVEASAEQKRPLLGALRVLDMTQSAGARSDFALNIERLQYAAPRLQQLRLNGLCGASRCCACCAVLRCAVLHPLSNSS